MKPSSVVGFVGAGRVGTALAGQMARLGYEIAGFADRHADRARAACQAVGIRQRRLTPVRLAERANLVFLTVPDREISPVFALVRSRLRPGVLVAHCSGFFGVEVCPDAGRAGLETLAFHPAVAFPGTGPGASGLAVSWPAGSFLFSVDGSPAGIRFGRRLAKQLGGEALVIRGPDRPLYHAMCVFASNFQHALRESAERIARELGVRECCRARLLDPLMAVTIENMTALGAGPGLTGPVRRGDAATVAGHLVALRRRLPELVPGYIELTRRLVELAGQQGTGRAQLQEIARLLDE